MDRLVEILSHISLIPAVKLEEEDFVHFLKNRIELLETQKEEVNKEVVEELKIILHVLSNIRTLPEEMSYLLNDIKVISNYIISYLMGKVSWNEALKRIELVMQKIDRVLYTYVVEDPKAYFKYSLMLKNLYRSLCRISHIIKRSDSLES
ncbi:MAG: hypothetical protein ABWJ98_06120 [Hydrogenothermaceae bacterium]